VVFLTPRSVEFLTQPVTPQKALGPSLLLLLFAQRELASASTLKAKMPRLSCALLAVVVVAVLSPERGMAAAPASDDDASKLRCANRTHGCSGHGDCTASGSCACDLHYEGARCDVWRSSSGATTSLAGLVNLKWHNCTHDADMRQRCARSNSTICERAGAVLSLSPSLSLSLPVGLATID
jgi:hypothetical protein